MTDTALHSRTEIIAANTTTDPGRISPMPPTVKTLVGVHLGEVKWQPVRILVGRDGQFNVGTVWTVTGKSGDLWTITRGVSTCDRVPGAFLTRA